ncbi:hypothetical protein CSUI_004329 [Cystoisospora suis]|uniref:Uncharacterized protein n=1 Tax=Cystoisospora suis TaxID=483139 RepID=A0A2C6KC21_9APIC|nr:hypothetical protein CSUI_004329 [Cystoisospora suis]
MRTEKITMDRLPTGSDRKSPSSLSLEGWPWRCEGSEKKERKKERKKKERNGLLRREPCERRRRETRRKMEEEEEKSRKEKKTVEEERSFDRTKQKGGVWEETEEWRRECISSFFSFSFLSFYLLPSSFSLLFFLVFLFPVSSVGCLSSTEIQRPGMPRCIQLRG